jgi:hypothetical protein
MNTSFSDSQIKKIENSLLFLNVSELKQVAKNLGLIFSKTKLELIDSIIYFLKTGIDKPSLIIPAVSKAKKGRSYQLLPNALMLHGSYKNDLKTRIFFKELIGPHFHFTAFGIDWLNSRWIFGNPPTYLEFSTMWQEQYLKSKTEKIAPKKEWAFINFVQNFLKDNQNSNKLIILNAWNVEREKNKEFVFSFLTKHYYSKVGSII